MNFSTKTRRFPRLAASGVALLAATGLALTTPPSEQQNGGTDLVILKSDLP